MSRRQRFLPCDEALATFPAVRDLTADAMRQIESLVNRIRSRDEMRRHQEEIEAAMQTIIERWSEEVTSLGCEVKGLWLVDWDNDDGYDCWRYPEGSIGHYHGYDEGFAGRVPVN